MVKHSSKAYLIEYFETDVFSVMTQRYDEMIVEDVFGAYCGYEEETIPPIKRHAFFWYVNGVVCLWSLPYLCIRCIRKTLLYATNYSARYFTRHPTFMLAFIKLLVNVIFFLPEVMCFMWSKIADYVFMTLAKLCWHEPIIFDDQQTYARKAARAADQKKPAPIVSSTIRISQKIGDPLAHSQTPNLSIIQDIQSHRDFLAHSASQATQKRSTNTIDTKAIDTLLTSLARRLNNISATFVYKSAAIRNKADEIEKQQLAADLDSLHSLLKSLSPYPDLYARALELAGIINQRSSALLSNQTHKP